MQDSHVQFSASRRAFIRGSSLFLLGASSGLLPGCSGREDEGLTEIIEQTANLKFSMVTDIHYADKEPAGTRFYRESIEKLQNAVRQFEKDQPQFLVALGDVIDAADEVEVEKEYLKRVHAILSSAPGEKHYVLGNHCVTTLTKDEFLDGVGQQKSYYSFDAGEFHFVILDACFREDGQPYGRNNFVWTDSNIPDDQLEWLRDDLASTDLSTIVFAHQRLDETELHSVKNAAAVRKILEHSGKVRAVFQGHSHENNHQEIEGIHYCVLAAIIEGGGMENNGYTTVDILEDETIRLTGFQKQADYLWKV